MKKAWFFAGVYFFILVFLDRQLLAGLLYGNMDLALNAQILWNLAHGSGSSSILGVHFLANHFIAAYYPLALVYRFCGGPLFLLALQAFALASGGPLVYLITRRRLGPPWPLLGALFYYAYPPVFYAGLDEFHNSVMAVPFLLLMIYFYQEKKLAWFCAASLAAMGWQENYASPVFMFGVLALIERRTRSWALAPMALGAAWFAAVVFVIQPRLNNGNIDMTSNYAHLFTHPAAWLDARFFGEGAAYAVKLFAPFLCLPLLGWRFLLPASLLFLQHLFSMSPWERHLASHYFAEFAPFLIVSTMGGIAFLAGRVPAGRLRLLVVPGVLAGCLLAFFVSYRGSIPLAQLRSFEPGPAIEAKRRMLERVPPGAAVVATFEFLPHLSQRRELYSFHFVVSGRHMHSTRPYRLPESVDYALLNLGDAFVFGFSGPDGRRRAADFLAGPWHTMDSYKDTVLLQRRR